LRPAAGVRDGNDIIDNIAGPGLGGAGPICYNPYLMTSGLDLPAGGQGRRGTRPWLPAAAVMGFLALLAGFYLRRISAAPPLIYDEIYYFALAKYLLAGYGYVDACFPGAPAHLHYPPLTSLCAAAAIKLFGEDFFLLRALHLLAGFAALLPAYLLVKRTDGRGKALAVVLLTAASAGVLPALATIRSDLPFLLFAFTFLLFAEKLRSGEDRSPAAYAAAGLFLALCCLSRQVGVVMLLVLPAALLAGAGGATRKKLLLFCAVSLLAYTAYFFVSGAGSNYLRVVSAAEESWRFSPAAYPFMLLKNAYAMLFYGFPPSLSGLRFESRNYFALALSLLTLAGFLLRLRRGPTAPELYFAVYGLLLLLAPATEVVAVRTLVALAPVSFLFLLTALEAAPWLRGRTAPLTGALLAGLLAVQALAPESRPEREAARLTAGTAELVGWAAADTKPGAVFLSNNPHALHLYAGRQSARSSHYFPVPALRRPDTALAWLYDNNVDYIVPDNFWERSAKEIFPALAACPACFEKRFAGGVFTAYEVNKQALRARLGAR